MTMPRTLARAMAASVLLLSGFAASEQPDWEASRMELPLVQVGPHTWVVLGRLEEASAANEGFIANAGFVIGDDGVVVYDTLGSPALADRMIREIRRLTDRPIRLAVVGHYHADHFYGIPALRAAGAAIWADDAARLYLNSEAGEARLAERRAQIGRYLGNDFSLPLPDRWITADEEFEMAGVQFALHRLGPAHSPDDLALLVKPDGVLFSGDLVYSGRVPFIGEANTRQWLDSLDRMLEIPATVMVPGHGPISREPQRDAQLTRDYLRFLRQKMGEAVANFESFDEAYARIDWSRFSEVPTFDAANRQNAYSVFLEMEQESLAQ